MPFSFDQFGMPQITGDGFLDVLNGLTSGGNPQFLNNSLATGGFFGLEDIEGTETGDRTVFQSFEPGNLSPTQSNQFQSLFTPTFNRFLGQIGKSIAGGEQPQESFTQFLASDQFNPQRELLRQPDTSRRQAPTFFRFNR